MALVGGESLVYWLRKLVFRGAWLDQRVKEGLLEVAWDDAEADFAYRDPFGGRAYSSSPPCPPGTSCSSGARRGAASQPPAGLGSVKPKLCAFSSECESSMRRMKPTGTTISSGSSSSRLCWRMVMKPKPGAGVSESSA